MLQLARAFLFSAILVVFIPSQAQTQQPQNRQSTASISGRVTIDGKPAVNASVILEELSPDPDQGGRVLHGSEVSIESFTLLKFKGRWKELRPGAVEQQIYAKSKTDADGRYRFTGLAEGRYSIHALSQAYVSKKARETDDGGWLVKLDDGEARENVDIEFVQGGVITGRVTDSEDRPIIASQMFLISIDEKGQHKQRFNFFNREAGATDDRGVYRLYGLPAGRYIVGVGNDGWNSGGNKGRRITLHPDVTDEKQAKIIEVKEGGVIDNVDIRIGAFGKVYEAVGRVTDEDTGQPIPRARLRCEAVREGADSIEGFFQSVDTDNEGRFKITGLVPGRYQLELQNFEKESKPYYAEKTHFVVHDADVSGLEIKAVRGATVSGVVVLPGVVDPAIRSKLHQMMLYVSVYGNSNSGIADGREDGDPVGSSDSEINPDGRFRMSGLPPGKLIFELLRTVRDSFQINRIERNGVSINQAIDITRREQIENLRIVVDYANGSIRGQVKIMGGNLPQNVRLYVSANRKTSPDKSGKHPPFRDSDSFGQVDEKGRFLIEGLASGEYDVIVTAGVVKEDGSSSAGAEPAQAHVTVNGGVETPVTIILNPYTGRQERKQ